MSVRLFIGNLPYDATEAELREFFSTVGQVSYVHLPKDRDTGKPRGFAFLEFNDRSQAEEAIRRFNNQLFKGRPLAVNEARAREDRPRTGISSQPSFSRPPSAPMTAVSDPLTRPDKPVRDFGPDAKPARNRAKSKGRQGSERVPKGPMREVVRGQIFAADDDDASEEDFLGENFASRVGESESEDDD